jgi:hypothetical protein
MNSEYILVFKRFKLGRNQTYKFENDVYLLFVAPILGCTSYLDRLARPCFFQQ